MKPVPRPKAVVARVEAAATAAAAVVPVAAGATKKWFQELWDRIPILSEFGQDWNPVPQVEQRGRESFRRTLSAPIVVIDHSWTHLEQPSLLLSMRPTRSVTARAEFPLPVTACLPFTKNPIRRVRIRPGWSTLPANRRLCRC